MPTCNKLRKGGQDVPQCKGCKRGSPCHRTLLQSKPCGCDYCATLVARGDLVADTTMHDAPPREARGTRRTAAKVDYAVSKEDNFFVGKDKLKADVMRDVKDRQKRKAWDDVDCTTPRKSKAMLQPKSAPWSANMEATLGTMLLGKQQAGGRCTCFCFALLCLPHAFVVGSAVCCSCRRGTL